MTSKTVPDHRAAQVALADKDATTYREDHHVIVRTGPTNTDVNELYVTVVTGSENVHRYSC